MAARRSDPHEHHKSAVPALGLLFVLACATPVIASQNIPSDCAELEAAGLQVPVIKLAAATVGENEAADPDAAKLSTQPLRAKAPEPLVDAPAENVSVQDLYSRRTPRAETAQTDDVESTVPPTMESADSVPDIEMRFPGVSSVELRRFKRQMYRRDI